MLGRASHGALLCAAMALLVSASACDVVSSGESDQQKATACEKPPSVPFSGSSVAKVPKDVPKPKSAKLTIAYANGLDASEPLHVEGLAAKAEVERLGGSFITDDAKGQPDLQVSQIQQFIARKVDGIFVSVVDPGALSPVLRQAKDAGIPVVGVEVDLESTDPPEGWASQIWLGRDKLAYLQTQHLARRVPCKGAYAHIDLAIRVPAIEYVVKRARFWAGKFGLKALGTSSNPTGDIPGGGQAMTKLLAKYPSVDGVLAYHDASATGARASARASGKPQLPVIGANGDSLGFQSVRSGKISATVQMQYVDAGRIGAWALHHLVAGEEVPKTVRTGDPRLITKANVDSVPTWPEQLEKRYGASE